MSEALDDKHPIQPREAREQAADYLGFMAGIPFTLGNNEVWELPNPAFLDPDQRKRYREHQRFMKTVDTEEVDHPILDGKKITQPVYPFTKDGKDVDEAERLCIALMTEDVYKKFIAAGGVPGQITVHWNQMQHQLEERMKDDSKSR